MIVLFKGESADQIISFNKEKKDPIAGLGDHFQIFTIMWLGKMLSIICADEIKKDSKKKLKELFQ